MRIQIRVRVECSVGRCASPDLPGWPGHGPTEWEGWVWASVPVPIPGDPRRLTRLDDPLPAGWATHRLEGSGESEPVCPECAADLGLVPSVAAPEPARTAVPAGGRGVEGRELPERLTGAQERELKALADKPQATYGSARARVQNNLVSMGLADYVDLDGERVPYTMMTPRSHLADRCVITELGRRWLGDRA